MIFNKLIAICFLLVSAGFSLQSSLNILRISYSDSEHVGEICSICMLKFQNGEKYFEDYWGNKFHSYHKANLDQCYSCNRLIHPNTCTSYPHKSGGYQYRDGRFMCNFCLKNDGVVFLDSDGEKILEELFNEAKEWTIDFPNIFTVKLVSEKELTEIRHSELREGERNPALTSLQISKKILLGGRVNIETKCDIYVLKGLQKSFFKECLAHELMHVWLFVNARFEPEPVLCEGVCNYFAYEILGKEKENKYAEFYRRLMDENPDAVYGEGFRKVKKLAEQLGGWENLLVYLKHNRKFP